jgi:hypothetical protein
MSTESPVRQAKHLPGLIQPVDYLATLWTHLTESLCQEVFELTRDKERQRVWSLFTLVQFWIGLLHHPSLSQTRAIEESQKGNPLFPEVAATPESFFQRIQSLRPAFFHNVFQRFVEAILPHAPTRFASHLSEALSAFPEVLVLDGSKLHKVARALKVARNITAAILPGSLEAVYDLRRGLLRNLIFSPDGTEGEKHLLLSALASIPKGSLLVYDRYACYTTYWKEMASHGLFLLTRAAGTLTLTVKEEILTVREGRCVLKEALVTVGKEKDAPWLRLIHWKTPHGEWKLLTNVMELDKLPAHVALELYGLRWSVERYFLTLKDTLDLNHLFNASPSAISGQVYATALVYDALRLAQAEIAQKVDVEPERLSPEKLFPRILENMVKLTWAEEGAEKYYWKVKAQNPEAPPPDLHLERLPAFKLSLQGITLEKRNGHRRKRRFCKGRRQFTSYSKIPGAKKYVQI